MITTLLQSKLHTGVKRAGILKILCLLLLTLVQASGWAQTIVTIPNPYENTAPEFNGGTILNTRQPLTNYEKFERSAAIYTSAEIGQSGSITAIAYEVKSVNNPQPVTARIYLRTIPTTTTSFGAGTTVQGEIAAATLVFDGVVSVTSTGWITINLTTPFAYTTANNLEVIVETYNNNGSFGVDVNQDAKLFTFNDNLANAFIFETESPTANPPLFRAITSFRPNIRLTIGGSTPPPTCNPVVVNSTTPGTNSVVFNYTAGSAGTHNITLTDAAGVAPTVNTTLGASPATVAGLQSGVTYNYSIVTSCTAGGTSTATTGQVTTTTTPPPTCAAPTTVSGTGTGQNTAQITFSGGDAGTSYTIQYGPTSTFPAGSTTTSATSSPANLSGLTAGTAYTFVVRTNCSNGVTSADSPQGTFNTTAAPVACDAPTTVSGTGTGQTTAQITFSGGTASSAYIIEYGPSSTFPTGTSTTNVSGSPANLTGLTPGTAYTFVIRTNCGNGNISANSQQGTFTTSSTPQTCAAPTTVSGTGTGQNTAQITFSGGDVGTSYTIQYGPSSTFPAGSTTTSATSSPANLSGLTAGTAYTFVVRTNCANGLTSSDSPQGTFNTSAAPVACDAPTTVSGTGTGQTTAQITFSGGTASSAYIIEYGPTSTFPSGTSTTNVSGSPANLTGLTPGTAYTFVIRTNCGNGNISANSQQGTFTTSSTPQTCAAPTTVSGTGTGQNTAQISFSGGDVGTSYTIQYGPTSTFPAGSTTTSATSSPANLSGLTAGTAYTFVVRTNCANGLTSSDSPQGTFSTTAAPVACDAPTTVSGTGTGQTTAQITFSGGTASRSEERR